MVLVFRQTEITEIRSKVKKSVIHDRIFHSKKQLAWAWREPRNQKPEQLTF